jgi:hypothetical protein
MKQLAASGVPKGTPLCPVCREQMTRDGRTYKCATCRQIIIFFTVSDASPYIALAAVPALSSSAGGDFVRSRYFAPCSSA